MTERQVPGAERNRREKSIFQTVGLSIHWSHAHRIPLGGNRIGDAPD